MSAELLRRAADRIEELAKGATPGPWARPRRGSAVICAPVADDEDRRYRDGRDEVVTVVRAQTWEGTGAFVRRRSGRDLDWVAALGPQVAAPLAAWLRAEADCFENTPAATRALTDLADAVTGEKWGIRALLSTEPQAVALARALLGEDPAVADVLPDGPQPSDTCAVPDPGEATSGLRHFADGGD